MAVLKNLKASIAEIQQRVMIRIANRTFKKNPNFLDRLAIRLVEKGAGPAGPPDPELEHPE